MAQDHPSNLSRLELLRLIEYEPEEAPPLLRRTCIIGVQRVPCRRVQCPCGFPWFSHVFLDAPGNKCPKCGSGASDRHAGPVVHEDFPVPVNLSNRGTVTSKE